VYSGRTNRITATIRIATIGLKITSTWSWISNGGIGEGTLTENNIYENKQLDYHLMKK
jgi:hypothetical protein